jgi:hypothetical protein
MGEKKMGFIDNIAFYKDKPLVFDGRFLGSKEIVHTNNMMGCGCEKTMNHIHSNKSGTTCYQYGFDERFRRIRRHCSG